VEFPVLATSRFDRDLKKLAAQHGELLEHYRGVLAALKQDPHNRNRRYPIKKLQGRASRRRSIPYQVGPLSIPLRY
jgi:mRNA-degrading endonuclease YafQ of YafQ-DinJ toxin-antitoxin module